MFGTGPTYGRLASHMILRDEKTNQRYISNEYVVPGNYRSLTWHPVKPGTWKNKGYVEIAGDISKLRTSTTPMEGKRTKELPKYIAGRTAYRKRSARRKDTAKRAITTKSTTSRKRKTTPTTLSSDEAKLARIRKRQRKIEARQNKETSKKKTSKTSLRSQMNEARRRAMKTRKTKQSTRTNRQTTRNTVIDLS